MTVPDRIHVDDLNAVPDLTVTEPSSWTPILLTSLPEKPPVEPTLGEVGLVYPGKRHVFSGPQESAKTLAAYAIALQVVRHGGTVLIIDFEMGAWDARNRLRELGATHDELQHMPYIEPHEPATEQHIAALVTAQPALVIIDAAAGAYDLQSLDDNKRQDVERLSRLYIRAFWRHGIATIMLDHVVKNAEGRGKYAIGSERKVGGADVHLGFETVVPIKRGAQGVYHIVTHKDRGGFLKRGRLADLHLSSHPDTHQITWEFRPAAETEDDRPQLPTILMERASHYLESQTEPVTRNQIVLNTKGNAEFVRAAIDHLVALGYAAEEAGMNRARLYTSTRPFIRSDYESKEETQVRPSSSKFVQDEPEGGSSDRPPPYGETDEPTGPQDDPVRPPEKDEPDDPEAQRLLDLYVTPKETPPDDLYDEPAYDPADDLPL